MVEQVENYEIKLRHVRASFVKVFKAEPFRGAKRGPSDGGEPSFSINFLISKSTEAGKKLHDDIRDLIDDAMDAKWGRDKPRLKADKFCLRDGDEEPYDGYEGNWYITARSRTRPKVVDADGKTPLAAEDNRPYSGCYVNGWVRIWVQDNDYGKRVNASLEAVQFVRDGEAFSGAAPIPDEEFEDERDPADRETSSRRSRDDDDARPARGARDADDERPARSRRDDDERRSPAPRDDDRSSRRGRRDEDAAPARRRI